MPFWRRSASRPNAKVSNTLDLIEKEAEKSLVLPEGVHPRQEVSRLAEFLKWGDRKLRHAHEEGAGGLEICGMRTRLMDLLLLAILRAIPMGNGGKGEPPVLAVVAHGGYGRSELNPRSDIDLLFLHDGKMKKGSREHPWVQVISGEGFLWDLQLKPGILVFSIEEAVRHANKDMVSKTAFSEARFVAGDRGLFEQFEAAISSKCIRGFENEYIEQRLQDQSERRAKFGNSACMVEPNVKSGCGGLRDFQNLVWMARFRYGTRSLEALEAQELILPEERADLSRAHDFLLRVRNELHFRYDRDLDTLHKNVQPSVATGLGYTSRSPSERLERFMGDLYTHMRNVYLTTKTVERRLALIPQPKRLPSFKQFLQQRKERAQYPVDGFKFIDGEIYPESPRVFHSDSSRLMRVFLHAQARDLVLHPNTTQLLKQSLGLVDRDYLKDEHPRKTFLEILAARGQVGRVLREMHETGFLGRYVPEFGRLTCKVQHEFFHQYAVDEHTLVCVEKLDQVWTSQRAEDQRYLEVFRGLDAPHVLYLALLLHDAGKAEETGHHELAGLKIAARVAKRLQLDAATTQNLLFLVEHHLLMAQVSQKRDLDDPEEIRHFAGQVGTVDQLGMLLLLTRSDSLGTSDKLWNGFKDSLLWTLYCKASEVLSRETAFLPAAGLLQDQRLAEVRRIAGSTLAAEEITAHFEGMQPRYFRVCDAEQIVQDIGLARRFMQRQLGDGQNSLKPIVQWQDDLDRGFTELRVCTWDRAGLFVKLTGSLTASGLNILGAQAFTRRDSIVIDTFFVTQAATGLMVEKESRGRFEDLLGDVFTGVVDVESAMPVGVGAVALHEGVESRAAWVDVHVDNKASINRTAIEVSTVDRMGLLYVISKALNDLRLDLQLAKICTEKGAATDVFYVVNMKSAGEPDDAVNVKDERLEEIRLRIQSDIERWLRIGPRDSKS